VVLTDAGLKLSVSFVTATCVALEALAYDFCVLTHWIDMYNDLIFRLKKRAEIRRQIPTRKSVQEGAPDRIADLLEEAAQAIERLTKNEDDSKKL
jgi:hypothetical protein